MEQNRGKILHNELEKEPRNKERLKDSYAVVKRYGTSKQLRWVNNIPIAPISYVQTKAPMLKKKSIQKYTSEGRNEIHENLGIDTTMLHTLLYQQLSGRSSSP